MSTGNATAASTTAASSVSQQDREGNDVVAFYFRPAKN